MTNVPFSIFCWKNLWSQGTNIAPHFRVLFLDKQILYKKTSSSVNWISLKQCKSGWELVQSVNFRPNNGYICICHPYMQANSTISLLCPIYPSSFGATCFFSPFPFLFLAFFFFFYCGLSCWTFTLAKNKSSCKKATSEILWPQLLPTIWKKIKVMDY